LIQHILNKAKSLRETLHCPFTPRCKRGAVAVQLDNTELIEQKMNYTHDNPVRAMIVGKQEDYLYSSARDYAGEKGLVNVQTVL
jgi:hypothetical protein